MTLFNYTKIYAVTQGPDEPIGHIKWSYGSNPFEAIDVDRKSRGHFLNRGQAAAGVCGLPNVGGGAAPKCND
jgi:hypothetical protein